MYTHTHTHTHIYKISPSEHSFKLVREQSHVKGEKGQTEG
jgi:hypothetical protein